MIDVYVKAGHIYTGNRGNKTKKNIVAMIITSSKFRWTKTFQIDEDLTRFQLECFGVIIALNHIRHKFRKKEIRVLTDSHFIQQMTSCNKYNEYTKNSKLEMVDDMRLVINRFTNIRFKKPLKKDENWEELEHIYTECGHDDIILNEKE